MDDQKPSAQPDKCPTKHPASVAAQRLPRVIFLHASDDNFQENAVSATAAAPDGAVSSQGQAKSVKEGRVEKITEWLTSVIGFDPVQSEMDVYARIFYNLGLHSVEMIINLCTKQRVGTFSWMKEFHRDRVATALQA
jgi:hypothetical protein